MSFFTVFENLALILYRHSRWQNTPLAIGPGEVYGPCIVCRFPALLSHHFTMIPYIRHMCPALYLFHAYQPPVWNILYSSLSHWNIVAIHCDRYLFSPRSRHCAVYQVYHCNESHISKKDKEMIEEVKKPTGSGLHMKGDKIPCPHMIGFEHELSQRITEYSYWEQFMQEVTCTSGEIYKGKKFFADCVTPIGKTIPNRMGGGMPDFEWKRKVKHHLAFCDYVWSCAAYTNIDSSGFLFLQNKVQTANISAEEFTTLRDHAISRKDNKFQQHKVCERGRLVTEL